MTAPHLSQEELKSILHYDPETGDFIRIKASQHINVGDIAGYLDGGYIQITVKNKSYKAHRLAFLYMTGEFPNDDVDHENHIKNDNRWKNIRACTQSQNQANVGPPKNNTSGYKGVYWGKHANKWHARIGFEGKKIHLGYYNDIKNAAIAYNIKAKEFFGEYAHLNEV